MASDPEIGITIYLDVSCLNRPFDDQDQLRIRLETAAITLILERCDREEWRAVSSRIAEIEIEATVDPERRSRVRLLLPEQKAILAMNESVVGRAVELEKLGFKAADALHVASAEELKATVLLSCDDRLNRLGKRQQRALLVRIANPLDWLREIADAVDS